MLRSLPSPKQTKPAAHLGFRTDRPASHRDGRPRSSEGERQRNALDLAVGASAPLAAIAPSRISAMLIDLGCRPGQEVRLERKGLFGSPLYLCIGNRRLAFRAEEARVLLLEPLIPAPASGDESGQGLGAAAVASAS
jgi:ferrous iron transport protein A